MLMENNLEQDEKVVKDKISDVKETVVEKTDIEIPTQEEKEEPVQEEIFDGDIDLSATRKKRFRINGDNSKILELNISDMNTMVRLQEDYPKLLKLANKAANIDTGNSDDLEEELNALGDSFKAIDKEMRELVDHIFNSNVSEICAADGSMYDLFNGVFRFEYIIEKIGDLYGTNIQKEFKAIAKRIQKHTDKYTGK